MISDGSLAAVLEEYKIDKSPWTVISVMKIVAFAISFALSVILCVLTKNAWFLLGLFVPIAIAFTVFIQIFLLKYDYVLISRDCIVICKGFFNKVEKKQLHNGVISVTMEQSVVGRIFNYGRINVNIFGVGMIHIDNVNEPCDVLDYLECLRVNSTGNVKRITVS